MPSKRKPRHRYRHIAAAAVETPWAILPGKLDEIMGLIDLRQAGYVLSGREIAARIGDVERPALRDEQAGGGIALLNLYGTIFHRATAFTEFSGGTSAEKFGAAFDAAVADESVEAIVINIDSPGGAVPGIQEVSDRIHAARGSKRIVAVANPMAASAAYWIGSQAEEFVAIPSATSIGSIGVLSVHTDRSAANEQAGIKRTYIASVEKKAQFNPDEPLSESDFDEAKASVSKIHATFVSHVARGRGIDVSAVNASFGAGRTFLASEALERGMIDRIATLESVIADLGGSMPHDDRVSADRFAPAFASCPPADTGDARFLQVAEILGLD